MRCPECNQRMVYPGDDLCDRCIEVVMAKESDRPELPPGVREGIAAARAALERAKENQKP